MLTAADFVSWIDVPRNVWDPTEGHHSRHGERPLSAIRRVECHWVGTGAVADHGDTGTELASFERYHERSKGWYDLFYNVGLDTEAYTYEGRDATIPSQSDLYESITVLWVVGNADPPLAPDVLDSMLVRVWELWGLVDPTRSPASLGWHRQRPWNPGTSQCPGDQIAEACARMRNGLWVPPFTPNPENPEEADMAGEITFYDDSDAKKTLAVWRDDDGRVNVYPYGTYREGFGEPGRGLSWVALAMFEKGRWVNAAE